MVKWEEEGGENYLLRIKVIDEEIVEVFFKVIGILVFKMMEGEKDKLFCMESVLYA